MYFTVNTSYKAEYEKQNLYGGRIKRVWKIKT